MADTPIIGAPIQRIVRPPDPGPFELRLVVILKPQGDPFLSVRGSMADARVKDQARRLLEFIAGMK
jgi:hypothetical protein